ncbi:lipopolysaccharide biosynthesis protein [Edaphobacter aggregans]|uniref:lipopolysaccharide biosynthesis protein n=1 Tax=Edaphobacter aggregans TaxID=570835 RepID=UPI000A0402F3|nr:lipopolysaccharide biosynthesis protein [Edaphobacter aggregans]
MTENSPSLLRWSYLSTISTVTMQLIASVTITRFLQPADYGLAAIASLCFGLTSVFTQLGMGRAVVQKPNLTDGNIRASFSLSVATGLGGFIILSALTPILAIYFREPRLPPVVIAFGLNLIFQSISSVAGGLLRREFRMRALFICDALGYLLSTFGLGLPLAIKGYGVWALVASNVSQPLIVAIAYWIARPHSVVPTFRKEDFAHITSFGGKASATTAIEALGGSLDLLIMGRLVSPASLGIYNRSLTLSTQPGYNLSIGLLRVFHPTIARATERSLAECHKILLNSERQLMALIFPSCVGAAIAAPTIIPVIFGEQWAAAVPVYQMLCLVAVLDASFHLPANQLEVFGLFRHKFLMQVAFAVAFGTGIVLAAPRGMVAIATMYAGLQLLRTLYHHWLSARSLRRSIWSLLTAWIPGIICSAVVGTVLYFAQFSIARSSHIKPAFQLVVLIVLAGATAISVFRFLFRKSVYEPWMLIVRGKKTKAALQPT